MTSSPLHLHNTPSTPSTSQSSQKRHQFYLQIKHSHKLSILHTLRQHYLQQQHSQYLTTLIEQTQSQITQTQLRMLVGMTKMKNQNAVIHIGNLFISGVIDERVFGVLGTDWLYQVDGGNRFYEWMLVCMVNRRIIDTKFGVYLHMLKGLHQARTTDEFRILNALKIVNFMLKNFKKQTTDSLISNPKASQLSRLVSFASSPNLQLSKQAHRLLSNLLNQESPQTTLQLLPLLSLTTALDTLKLGQASQLSHIRSLTCQTLTNSLQPLLHSTFGDSHEDIEELVWSFFNLLENEKEKVNVKVEVSYLMVAYVQGSGIEGLLAGVVGRGLVKLVKGFGDCEGNVDIRSNYERLCQYFYELCCHHEPTSEIERRCLERIAGQVQSQGLYIPDYQI